MDNNNIIKLIYYVGIASCATQGAEKGKNEENIPVLRYITNAFGGGFMRDIFCLKMHPWLLTLSALPEIAWVVICGFLYTYYFFIYKASKKQYGIAMRIVSITDAFGLGSFICIGMERAFTHSNNVFTIITSGYITAIGGGILASGKSFTKIFKNRETIFYHFITLLGCYYYYIFRHSLSLVFFIFIGLFLTNINYRTLCNLYSCNLRILYPGIFLRYPVISNKNNSLQRRKIIKDVKRPIICKERPKIYLMQQRIRQC